MFTKFYRIQKNGFTTDRKFLAINGSFLLEEDNDIVAYGVTENIINGIPRIAIYTLGDGKGKISSELVRCFKRLIVKSDRFNNKLYCRRKYEIISVDSAYLHDDSFKLTSAVFDKKTMANETPKIYGDVRIMPFR